MQGKGHHVDETLGPGVYRPKRRVAEVESANEVTHEAGGVDEPLEAFLLVPGQIMMLKDVEIGQRFGKRFLRNWWRNSTGIDSLRGGC